MSVSEIREKENGSAFEVIIKSPNRDVNQVLAAKANNSPRAPPRAPLVDRLDNASKRYVEQLNEKKNKAAEISTKVKVVKEKQAEKVESQIAATTERIKSADTKRRSILDEKVAKGKADVDKAKGLSKQKRDEEEAKLKQLQAKIHEKANKAEEIHAKQIELVKEKAKVAPKPKPAELEEQFRKETAEKLQIKMSSVGEKRNKLIAEEKRKLQQHHEKVIETQKKAEIIKKQDEE